VALQFQLPLYEPELVDLAGDALIDYADAVEHFERIGLDYRDVITNWRLSHAYPLNTFQMTLRNRSKTMPNAVVAQRIKRPDSIESKLRRYDDLKLSAIQDIGGCRAIVSSVAQVYELVRRYQRKYSLHILDDEDDYINEPKADGYRSYHLIVRYSDPKHPKYENLKIEMQLRSPLQHAWATAVETVDMFLGEGLKSHRGSPEWRRFFALMGSSIAVREGTHRVPRTPGDDGELTRELRQLAQHLDVFNRLEAYRRTLSIAKDIRRRYDIKWVVLVFTPGMDASKLQLYGYKAGQLDSATEQLEALERYKAKGTDALLVSVAGAANLANAYRNYFLDTQQFLEALRQALS